ncbi:hypothetical protein GWI33_010168 [Rhynchophorus ferrugineus]|uniref:Uncharacterized protein n=1 Tax=Rhynchophorus ferrugineus TaxID=354439 RepID=A0A834ICI2_RHYFE|nr:hypothetical protein GWI33_010168 [Rhynchophorus ferrugineus]
MESNKRKDRGSRPIGKHKTGIVPSPKPDDLSFYLGGEERPPRKGLKRNPSYIYSQHTPPERNGQLAVRGTGSG